MAVVAGVGVAHDEAGEAGIAPYLIALPTATIIQTVPMTIDHLNT
jgi:hypothetical protein